MKPGQIHDPEAGLFIGIAFECLRGAAIILTVIGGAAMLGSCGATPTTLGGARTTTEICTEKYTAQISCLKSRGRFLDAAYLESNQIILQSRCGQLLFIRAQLVCETKAYSECAVLGLESKIAACAGALCD